MADVVGSDVPKGSEVKWYHGGVAYTEALTNPANDTAVALTKTAEFGSVIGTLDGLPAAITEFQSDGTTPATDATGTAKIKIAGADGVKDAVVYYIDNATTGLTHIGSCQDVKSDSGSNLKTAPIHGQATKINTVGAVENSASLEEFYYNQDFVKAVMGDQIVNSPASGKKKWTNKTRGARKIGALVGKRRDASGNVIHKWFMVGAQANGLSGGFPVEDFYKKSMKFTIDYLTEAKIPAA